MKDKIYEKYGYKVDCLTYKNDSISFNLGNFRYMLLKTNFSNEKLSIIDMIVKKLDSYAIFFHQLISSGDGYILKFGEHSYVLIRLRITSDRKITMNEILKLSSISINCSLENQLVEKIDFLENYFSNYQKLELANIDYFIGLTENAITLFNIIGKGNKNFIGHKRLHYDERAVDFYNPLNIVLDYRTRDLAEYAKSAFINGNNCIIEILELLHPADYFSFFARLIFPSFYFDSIDQYIKYGTKMDKKRISSLANSLEKNLRQVYNLIYPNLPYIEWLSYIDNF